MKTKRPIVNIMIQDKRWSEFSKLLRAEINALFSSIANALNQDFSKDEVALVLMNDSEIQQLNKVYRQKDKPTNVLSFPSNIEGELGDILLSYETVLKEANKASLPVMHHILHLIVHGFLHLLGYDHETDEQAHVMENLEIQILKHLNIQNPYEDQ